MIIYGVGDRQNAQRLQFLLNYGNQVASGFLFRASFLKSSKPILININNGAILFYQ